MVLVTMVLVTIPPYHHYGNSLYKYYETLIHNTYKEKIESVTKKSYQQTRHHGVGNNGVGNNTTIPPYKPTIRLSYIPYTYYLFTNKSS